MPWGRADAMLNNGKQSGGYDVKKVEASSDTNLVVLAQEKGPGKQFVRISLNASADGRQIVGILLQPTQPPPELAPPKMTPAEQEAARQAPPFRQFSAWLAAFNSGDRSRMDAYLKANVPSANLDGQMNFRQRTGGLELRALEQASATSLSGLVQERDSDQFGRFTMIVESDEPHRITRFPVAAIPRPAEFALAKMSEPELIAALRTQLEKDAAADRFAGAVLLSKNGRVLFSSACGLANREKGLANKVDTRFRLGSMNKMFTAVAVLQLVQAGKIKLTDPLGKYIPDYPNQDVAAKVTIHHLLTHTVAPKSKRALGKR